MLCLWLYRFIASAPHNVAESSLLMLLPPEYADAESALKARKRRKRARRDRRGVGLSIPAAPARLNSRSAGYSQGGR